jgi:hypothetical protein
VLLRGQALRDLVRRLDGRWAGLLQLVASGPPPTGPAPSPPPTPPTLAEYDRLKKELEYSREIGRFYESMAHKQAEKLEALKRKARTPVPPMPTRPPDFGKEPAAVATRALREFEKETAPYCCQACRVSVQDFFERFIVRLLGED